MRTRNAARPKPSPSVKQTPPAKKTGVKTPQKSPALSPEPSATSKSSGTKRTRAIQAKNKEIVDVPTPEPAVVEEKTSADDVTPDKKPVSVKKVTRVVRRKVVKKKTPLSVKSSSVETSSQGDAGKEESSKEEEEEEIKDANHEESVKNTEVTPVNPKEPEKDEPPTELVEETPTKEDTEDTSNRGSRVAKRKVVKKKTSVLSKCSSVETCKPGDAGKEESLKEEDEEIKDAKNEESVKNKEATLANLEEPEEDEPPTELVEEALTKETEDTSNRGSDCNKDVILVNADQCKLTDITVDHVEESITKEDTVHNQDVTNIEEVAGEPNPSVEDIGTSLMQKKSVAKDAVISSPQDLTVMEVNILKSQVGKEEEEAKELLERTEIVEDRIDITTEIVQSEELKEDEVSEQADTEHKDEVMGKTEIVEDRMDTTTELLNMEESTTEALKEEAPEQSDVEHEDGKTEEQGGEAIPKEFNEEGLAKDNATQHVEEVQRSEDEHAELNALAEERKRKKELEIFVGGLDRDAVDEDVRKAFQHIGDVVEIRVHKDPSNSKNKGYAFVKFGSKEQATRALAEVKHPVINGKRCGTAPCEDNDTLFLGNICNTWTKEAIRQKLKDYGIDGVESITLVPDPKHEGLSRGFSFIEFSCHGDAMLAYKRLQKPDVIFGHLERTAKVAFAEPLREPDPEVMSQVKSVFVDGLPPQWDEDHVRKEFKGYGDIVQITLARNMSTSKRKDFGFVDFSNHEAAVACIDDINSRGLGDGNSKAKVKARLSNPLPKTQAVKGEMCGGFRIGRVSSGTPPQPAKGAGRGAHPFNRTNYQRGRESYHHGRGQAGRMGFFNDHDFTEPFRGRQNFGQVGGRWGSSRGAHAIPGGGTIPARFNLDRPSHGPMDRGHVRHMPPRGQPFPPEDFNRPFPERHYDDPYLYRDRAHGIKRPLYTDQDPRYMEPSRVRPRLDYANPAFPYHGSHRRDASGSGSSMYPHDYRGPNYGGDIRPSFFGGDRPYRGGYRY